MMKTCNSIATRWFCRIILLIVLLWGTASVTHSQSPLPSDSTLIPQVDTVRIGSPYRIKPLQLILPASLITVGIIGLESDWLEYHNHEIRDELQENIDHRLSFDDYTQYAPIAAMYGLNMMGVKGKHRVVDQTILLGTASVLMAVSVNTLKKTTRVERPDGSTRNSFPSGHTATAFMGAELLRREYWVVSPWIGVTGYAMATCTGFFRMYNNRHWLTDVIAGAGIGILSVEAAYWLYPAVTKLLFPKQYRDHLLLSPYATQREKGISVNLSF